MKLTKAQRAERQARIDELMRDYGAPFLAEMVADAEWREEQMGNRRLTPESVRVAVHQIKERFAMNMAAGGGGRGGSPSKVLREATERAELAACVFADYFTELDPAFDPDGFFRACCLREAFIERMSRARAAHARKTRRVAAAESGRKVVEGER